MRAHLAVVWRGFLIVFATAVNVGQIAGRHWGGAFVGGFAISFLWWTNAHRAAHADLRFGREAYALGAGLGTVAGMGFVRLLYG